MVGWWALIGVGSLLSSCFCCAWIADAFFSVNDLFSAWRLRRCVGEYLAGFIAMPCTHETQHMLQPHSCLLCGNRLSCLWNEGGGDVHP